MVYLQELAILIQLRILDGPKENWRPSVSTVKAVIKFVMATKKLTYTSESETEGSVEE